MKKTNMYDPKKNIKNINSIKVADKLAKKLDKRKEKLKIYYDKLKEKRIAEINKLYDKKLEKRTRNIEIFYEEKRKKEKAKIYGRKCAKNNRMGKIRLNAYVAFQKWRKLSLSNKRGLVMLADKGYMVHRSKAVAGHIYSKKNYGHMAFISNNVRPITKDTNKSQGTSTGLYRAVNVLSLPQLDELEILSKDEIQKNSIRDRNYYKSMLDSFNSLIEIEKARLGKFYYLITSNEIS